MLLPFLRVGILVLSARWRIYIQLLVTSGYGFVLAII